MSNIQNQLDVLTQAYKKAQIRFEEQKWEYLKSSIKDLINKKLVLERDAQQISTIEWQKAAAHNWMKEPQFSSRCPNCQIDIIGPRKLIHYHLKVHDSKLTEHRENESFLQNFRIHYPTFKEFF